MKTQFNEIETEKYLFFRRANMPADIALDLAQRFAKSLSAVRNAESKMDTIGEQDPMEAQWAKEWANKGETPLNPQDAVINGLTRVEVEEVYN